MRLFTDDAKLCAPIRSEADSISLQYDLVKLVEWSTCADPRGGAPGARPPFSLEGIFLTLIIFAQGSK